MVMVHHVLIQAYHKQLYVPINLADRNYFHGERNFTFHDVHEGKSNQLVSAVNLLVILQSWNLGYCHDHQCSIDTCSEGEAWSVMNSDLLVNDRCPLD